MLSCLPREIARIATGSGRKPATPVIVVIRQKLRIQTQNSPSIISHDSGVVVEDETRKPRASDKQSLVGKSCGTRSSDPYSFLNQVTNHSTFAAVKSDRYDRTERG